MDRATIPAVPFAVEPARTGPLDFMVTVDVPPCEGGPRGMGTAVFWEPLRLAGGIP